MEVLILVVLSKAPKLRHYLKSESFNFRIALAFCQKNTDQIYMTDVNTAIVWSPGKVCHKSSSQQEKVKLKKKEESSSSVQFKKRRVQLKENRRSSGSLQELREGVTYESLLA